MPSVTWDSAFEASPADTDDEKYGALKIRDLKLAISERLEVEHAFKATGKHSPGKVSVVYEGTASQIAALTGMSAGALAFDTDIGQWKRYDGANWIAHSSILTAAAGGTVDAITATFSPALGALTNDTKVCVIAAGANTVGDPTFAPNGLTAKPIVQGADQPIAIGAIPGANYPTLLIYNSTFDAWVLINPHYKGDIQVVNYQRADLVQNTTNTMPYDDTIPQVAEGVEALSLAITPSSISNKLRIDIVLQGSASNAGVYFVAGLFLDGAANAIAAAAYYSPGNPEVGNLAFTYYMTAGSVGELTFTVRFGASTGNAAINGLSSGSRRLGGVNFSSITITEIQV